MNKSELLNLKESIETAKSQVSKLEGRQEHLQQELKDNWNADDLKAAKKKLKQLHKNLDKINSKMQEQNEKLKELYLNEESTEE